MPLYRCAIREGLSNEVQREQIAKEEGIKKAQVDVPHYRVKLKLVGVAPRTYARATTFGVFLASGSASNARPEASVRTSVSSAPRAETAA